MIFVREGWVNVNIYELEIKEKYSGYSLNKSKETFH